MIQEIRMKNILSIKDEVTISFIPKKAHMKTYSDSLFIPIDDSRKVLKGAIIYGANASGKSNIVRALDFFFKTILSGKKDRKEPIAFIPFKFDPSTVNGNGSFLIDFFIETVRYIYTLELNAHSIIRESLVYYPSTQPATIFLRSVNEETGRPLIQFGQKAGLDVYQRQYIQQGTNYNETVFATIGSSNIENDLLNTVYAYMNESFLPLISPLTDLESWAVKTISSDKVTYEAFILQMLNRADIQIRDFSIEDEEISFDESMLSMLKADIEIPKNVKEKILTEKKLEMTKAHFSHAYSGGSAVLDIDEESRGTRRFLGLSVVLHELLKNSHLAIIDEIESSLHPDLLGFYIQMFLFNSTSSQMIITTHNTRLLESDYLSPDMFVFCEKDPQSGESVLARGSDFGLHKNNSIANFYKIGKLGAVPNLGSILVSEDSVSYHE